MEPKEWQLLLDFFRRLRQKTYEVKYERRVVTMATRRLEQPLINRLDFLIKLAESKVRQDVRDVKHSKESWTYIVSILRKERDFFEEFKKDRELKQTLQKFLDRGKNEKPF